MTPTLFKDFQSRYGGYSLVKLRVDDTAVSFVLPSVAMLIILVILRADMWVIVKSNWEQLDTVASLVIPRAESDGG